MEHSKLPWKTGTKGIIESGDVMIQAADGHATWVARVIGGIPTKELKANANLIVKACNEHDILKAKAELFDDMMKTWRLIFTAGPKPVPMMAAIDLFEQKAKEIGK